MSEVIESLVYRIGGARRAAILVVGLGAAAAIWGLSRWATAPSWVMLYPGMPMELVGEVTGKLDEAGVIYRLEAGGGRLLVAESDLARARVLLAREGIPARGRPGFELFDQPSWGMTDFTQRINYRRALEGELERTLAQMRDVESAQVHLALPETQGLRRAEQPPQASVVLKLRTGARPNQELVEGAGSLVASSVPGLESGQVTVLDNAGRVLAAAAEPGMLEGMARRQLAVRQELETYLKTKAEEIVADVVGPGNVRVQVAVLLNFDRLDRTTQEVDPDRQIVAQEEKSEIVPGPGTPGAGSVTSSARYETSRRVETFSSSGGTVQRLTVSVLVSDRKVGEGEATRYEPRSADELARVEALVRNAVGLDAERGDAISVVSVPFDARPVPEAEPEPKASLMSGVARVQRPVAAGLALFLVFGLALRVIGSLKSAGGYAPPGYSIPGLPPQAHGHAHGVASAGESQVSLPRPAPIPAEPDDRERLASTVIARPDIAARVVKAWLKEA